VPTLNDMYVDKATLTGKWQLKKNVLPQGCFSPVLDKAMFNRGAAAIDGSSNYIAQWQWPKGPAIYSLLQVPT
jgi:hypothetical protein